MPIHDWTRVGPGTFHAFHYCWLHAIRRRLNRGVLPPGYRAMPEQYVLSSEGGGPEGDVVAFARPGAVPPSPARSNGPTATLSRPAARYIHQSQAEMYARRADHLAVQTENGTVVAVIEVVSPGNKRGRAALKTFADKAAGLLRSGVHLLVIDILPPGTLDPQGIHPVIWGDYDASPFTPPEGEPLTVAAYQAGPFATAYVEPTAVGQPVPPMPLFLDGDFYVTVPLEETYADAWDDQVPEVQRLVAGGGAAGA